MLAVNCDKGAGDVSTKPWVTGEREVTVKTIARGMPGRSVDRGDDA